MKNTNACPLPSCCVVCCVLYMMIALNFSLLPLSWFLHVDFVGIMSGKWLWMDDYRWNVHVVITLCFTRKPAIAKTSIVLALLMASFFYISSSSTEIVCFNMDAKNNTHIPIGEVGIISTSLIMVPHISYLTMNE